MPETFEWDEDKNQENQEKHKLSFEQAQMIFADPNLLLLKDERHSTPKEERFYAIGRIQEGIVTVRFTVRNGTIRIFGAGFWSKYRKWYVDRV